MDFGDTNWCVSIVERHGPYCVLVNAEEYHKNQWQTFMDEQPER